MAGLTSKRTYIRGLSRQPHNEKISTTARILKVYIEDLTGHLNWAVSLKMVSAVRRVGRAYSPRTGNGERSRQLPGVKQWSHPPDGFSNIPVLPSRPAFTMLHTSLFCRCALSSQQGVSASTEVAHLAVICLHWRQVLRQQYGHLEEKTVIKLVIPKISKNFFPPRTPWSEPLIY